MSRLIDADEVKKRFPIMENDFGMVVNERLHKELDKIPPEEVILKADYENRLKADTMAKFKEFRDKLSKWMFHNNESVCGNRMIDIDYLEGQMDELLYELGIYEVNEDENNRLE